MTTGEKSWTPWGFCDPDEAERRRVAEQAGAQVCVCGHPRREHHPGSCVHSVRRFSPAPFRSPCTCVGFEAASPVSSIGGGPENGSGNHTGRGEGHWTDGPDAA